MGLFGWLSKTKHPVDVVTPLSPTNTDGAIQVNSGNLSGYYAFNFEIDSTLSDELQMFLRYRDTASFPECDMAIEQIVNEMVIIDGVKPPISLNLDNLPKGYKTIKNRIREEWEKVLDLYKFNDNCHDIIKRWYIDGRIYYYMVIDEKNPKRGILDLRFIDPRKIKKITEIKKELKDGVEIVKGTESYYMFNDNGLQNADKGIKMSPDMIVDVPSGMVDANTGKVISYLFKAIKPVNQLKMMEDALVIYRITRAPERRLFYVDVGNLPAQKAEQYVQNIMNKFRNKVQYDAQTGEIKNSRNYLSMCEDFWIPRREGGRSTEVQTLPAGQNLSEIEDIRYFQNKLYQSLGVPKQRLNPDNNGFQLGRSDNISRDEIIFSKLVQRLRNKFNLMFKIPLKTQLILKNVIKEKDWKNIENHIFFDYIKDNSFEEIKEQELLMDRLNALSQADSYKGTYFSIEWIARHIMRMTDDEWKLMQKQMEAEKKADPEAFGLEGNEGENSDNSEEDSVSDDSREDDDSDEDIDDIDDDSSETEKDSDDESDEDEQEEEVSPRVLI